LARLHRPAALKGLLAVLLPLAARDQHTNQVKEAMRRLAACVWEDQSATVRITLDSGTSGDQTGPFCTFLRGFMKGPLGEGQMFLTSAMETAAVVAEAVWVAVKGCDGGTTQFGGDGGQRVAVVSLLLAPMLQAAPASFRVAFFRHHAEEIVQLAQAPSSSTNQGMLTCWVLLTCRIVNVDLDGLLPVDQSSPR
jgi:hypothetical protein